MKVSLDWIQQYVTLPDAVPMEDISRDVTMRTVEVEGYEDLRKTYDRVVVGRILSVAPHPDADSLRVTQVDVGEENLQIVCGGVNLYEGQYVVVTLPGAYAIWHGEGEPVKIGVTELRGVVSHGMICGANELGLEGLFPPQVAHEIIDLKGLDVTPGMPLTQALPLDDVILEIDNKSLTNRPDLWGHYGLARELAAIYQQPLRALPERTVFPSAPYPVRIESAACSRYTALAMDGLDARPAPLALQAALMKVGVRPINAIVDITNYVMLATGQPTHAFDRDHVQGGIVVRQARPDETLTLLDGETLPLSPEDLLIADEEKALGLAGVMGGAKDSILPETTRVLLEIASFAPAGIRKTAQRHGLRTESSMRFEKGIDQARVEQAAGLAESLFRAIFPEVQFVAYGESYPQPEEEVQVVVSGDWLSRRLGTPVGEAEFEERLTPLGFQVIARAEGEWTIQVPTWRATGDVSLPDDILEEVARMKGYENFEVQYPRVTLTKAIHQPRADLDRNLREYLAMRCGFQEIFTYPWVPAAYREAAGCSEEGTLQLAQPPAPDEKVLRDSLVPGMLQAVASNVRYFAGFRLFELTQVFAKGSERPADEEGEVLPLQRRFLCGAMVGEEPVRLFYELKGVVESFNTYLQMQPLTLCQEGDKPAWADRKAWMSIHRGEQRIGVLGLLAPMTKSLADIKFREVAVFELNVEALEPLDSRTNTFTPLPQYPHVEQDLSVLVDRQVTWEAIVRALGERANAVNFVDEYVGPQIPEQKKSLTLHLEFASDTGTLTNEEIAERMARVKQALASLGASIREQ